MNSDINPAFGKYYSCLISQADLLEVKDAISSALDIMQAMGSSICSLLSKVNCLYNIHLVTFHQVESNFVFIFHHHF